MCQNVVEILQTKTRERKSVRIYSDTDGRRTVNSGTIVGLVKKLNEPEDFTVMVYLQVLYQVWIQVVPI